MANGSDASPSAQRLNGWKDIAAYLGKSISSVQRWERELGLPVRRIKTAEGWIVSASPTEIEEWRHKLEKQADLSLEESSSPTPPGAGLPAAAQASLQSSPLGTSLRSWLVAGASILLVIGTFFLRDALLSGREPRISKITLDGHVLNARDPSDHVLWSYPFSEDVSLDDVIPSLGADDGRIAATEWPGTQGLVHLVPIRFASLQMPGRQSDSVLAFSTAGRLLWSVSPPSALRCGDSGYEGPWQLNAVHVATTSGHPRIWLAYSGGISWPGIVGEVLPGGKWVTRYLQTGWVMSLAEFSTSHGRLLAAGGVIADENQPSVVLLDPDGPAAMNLHTDKRFDCEERPTALPEREYLLPNLDLAAADGISYIMVNRLRDLGSGLDATIGGSQAVVSLTEDGANLLTFTDIYWPLHRKLEEAGKIAHSFLKCPEAAGPQQVRTWTKATGWQTLKVPIANGPRPPQTP
jgi:hypothetical protein